MSTGDENAAQRTTTAATGFCELGMWQSAWDEMETLPAEECADPVVLRIRLGIFIATERWESAAFLAEGLIAGGDDSPIAWLYGALAIRRHRSIEEARTFLLRAEPRLQNNASFYYSLAVYECQVGNLLGPKCASAARWSSILTFRRWLWMMRTLRRAGGQGRRISTATGSLHAPPDAGEHRSCNRMMLSEILERLDMTPAQ